MSAKDLFSKCHTLKKKKMLLTAEKKMNLFNSPLQSFSLPATYTTNCYTTRWKNQYGALLIGHCLCYPDWALLIALKCSLLKWLILALYSVFFFTGCACLNLSDPWHCDSCCSIYCDNKTTRGYGTSETEISTRLMKSEKTLIDILP